MTGASADDPLEALRLPLEGPIRPRAAFVSELRGQLTAALGLDAPAVPAIALPPRRTTVPPAPTETAALATALTPYLAVHDGAAALAFYTEAFGAVEESRFTGPDGRIGHAELVIGTVRLFLSDEYPEVGALSPRTLGGSTAALHLEVADVDAVHTRAVAAGATSERPPADQPYGARQGSIADPFGHRWLLSQPQADVSTAELERRMGDDGWTLTGRPRVARGGIWGVVHSADAPAMIRFLTEVIGFEAALVIQDEPGIVEHSELVWPEGGVVQVGTANQPGNVFADRPGPGQQNLYVITADPSAVLERCRAAGVAVVRDMAEPAYDPGGLGFAIADPEGNLWSFGTYAGEV